MEWRTVPPGEKERKLARARVLFGPMFRKRHRLRSDWQFGTRQAAAVRPSAPRREVTEG
jgi:hypothetical protein